MPDVPPIRSVGNSPIAPPVTPIQPPPTASDPPKTAQAQPRTVKFAIEIAGDKNQNVMCPLDSQIARGRWARKNIAGATYEPEFAVLPDVPGLVFVMNSQKRTIRRFDPLAQNDPASKRVLSKIKQVTQSVFKTRNEPDREFIWEECDDDFLKTFAFWILRLHGEGLCELVPNSGKVPTLEDVKSMPGMVNLAPYDSSAEIDRRIPNERLRYRPPVKDKSDAFIHDDELEPIKIHFGMEGQYLDDGMDGEGDAQII